MNDVPIAQLTSDSLSSPTLRLYSSPIRVLHDYAQHEVVCATCMQKTLVVIVLIERLLGSDDLKNLIYYFTTRKRQFLLLDDESRTREGVSKL